MTDDEARAALAEVSSSCQDRFEELYRAILHDLAERYAERGLSWPQIQSKEILDGMERMQGRAWARATEAHWLDRALEYGFSFPNVDIAETPSDAGEDG